MKKQMQAIVLEKTGGTDVLQVQTVEIPQPAPNQVLIRNQAAALNYVDVLVRQSAMPPDAMPNLPHILGVEGSGIIESAGSEVSHLEAGQRCLWFGVMGTGGYRANQPGH